MSSASVVPATGSKLVAGRPVNALKERAFFSSMAGLMALIAFAGFAPSYYLKAHFGAPPALTPLLHWHGAAFTLWMVLLITQTSLIASGRVGAVRRRDLFPAASGYPQTIDADCNDGIDHRC